MASTDKVEAVQKMAETQGKHSMNPIEEVEQLSSNKEHFQSLLDSSKPIKPNSIERIDNKAFASEETQSIEKKPIFAEENVTAQKSGSATDQERQRRQSQDAEVEGVKATKKPSNASKSLMSEVGKLNTHVSKMSKLSPDTIKTQVKDVISQMEQVKTKLAETQTELKPSYQTVLRNRLTHIDDNLKIALSKAGVEYTPSTQPTTTGKANPIRQFISMMTDSQNQLESLKDNVEKLSLDGAQISPANMLAIQMKMGYIQQQMELFSNLLNKALESTKTIMNVQV